MQQLLDLIAEMIAILLDEAKEKPELVDGIDNLSEKDDNTRRIEAQNLLESYGFGENYTVLFDKKEHEFQGILDAFKKTPSFHCKRWILMLLSRKVSWETFADIQSGEPFYSMNSNLQETGIILLPKVPVTVTTYDGRPRKDPLRFSSWLNPLLEGCYFIAADKLIANGRTFRINNIIYQPVLNTVCRTSLQVAYSPLCNGRIEDFLQIEKRDVTKENGETHGVFTVDGIRTEKESYIEDRFVNLYNTACEKMVDIVCSCEMLCTKRLFEIDEAGFNPVLVELIAKHTQDRIPSLILAPTRSEKGKNSLRVFDSTGKHLRTQDKQYGYTYERHTEDLSRCLNEIWILHIPYWGKIVFPICKDLLQQEYRNLLLQEIRANILICPSFSSGSTDFELAASAVKAYAASSIWGNSCIAASEHWDGFIGVIYIPAIGENVSERRIMAECNQKCSENCAFLVHLPLDCAGDDRHKDIGAYVSHIF